MKNEKNCNKNVEKKHNKKEVQVLHTPENQIFVIILFLYFNRYENNIYIYHFCHFVIAHVKRKCRLQWLVTSVLRNGGAQVRNKYIVLFFLSHKSVLYPVNIYSFSLFFFLSLSLNTKIYN